MSSITGVAAEARELTARADVLRAQCEALAASTEDETSRATLARVAGRLDSSVVRPLNAALQSTAESHATDPLAGAAELAHQLHLLAVDATRLRVRAAAAPSLQEAAAALNVQTVTDWLGVSLDPAPQSALCRCGASMLKPWCDGSHAQIGWEDAKSENRVPDRLDRYNGLGVSVADNRGTCAHSGFCLIACRPCSAPTRSHS
jgi:CDGSH-type Zn-finger protein